IDTKMFALLTSILSRHETGHGGLVPDFERAPSTTSDGYYGGVATEVVLRDFDGSRTIYPTELPLREIIHTAEAEDLNTEVVKIYVKTDEKDDQGRIVYAELR